MSMRDVIRGKLMGIPDNEAKFNLLREYLQSLVLKFIEEKDYSKDIAFVGGTSLRFVYDLQRFSEDLDFSQISQGSFGFEKFVDEIINHLASLGILVEHKTKIVRNVKSSYLKFPELMFENGLTHRKDQKLLIKLDIDTKPPLGFATEVSFVQKLISMNILHFDLPSLFAGKLHAILMRQYTKGRDFYDFTWFVGRKVIPNYDLLKNALFQTTGQMIEMEGNKLRDMLKKRMETVDWKKAASEVGRFLVNKDEMKYITRDVFGQLIEKAALSLR